MIRRPCVRSIRPAQFSSAAIGIASVACILRFVAYARPPADRNLGAAQTRRLNLSSRDRAVRWIRARRLFYG